MTVHECLYVSVMLIRLESLDPELARMTRLVIEEADAREKQATAQLAVVKRMQREAEDELEIGASA